jgi:hypothetical protein
MGKKAGVAYPGTIEVFLLPPIETEGKTAKDDLMNLMNESREAIANELVSGSEKLTK